MNIPLELSFLHMNPSESLTQTVQEKMLKLERFTKNITHFKVVIEAPHKHQHKGNLYHVRIDVTLPGHEFIINRGPTKHQAHEDVAVAIRDSFNAATRQLEEYTRIQRGETKSHEYYRHGKLVHT